MVFWKRGCQRPNIRKKDSGQVEWAMGSFALLVMGILACSQLQIAAWRSAGLYLEDALAASNLASALVDVREYGMTRRIVISDASAAYAIYCKAVKENLQLDDEWRCGNKSMIAGTVEIADYIVYNVDGDLVSASRVGGEGLVQEEWSGERGVLKTPNGIVVESPGIYSEITFPASGFLGIRIQARKGSFVDICSKGV